MNVPFIDLKKQYEQIKDRVAKDFNHIMENTAFIGGKPVSDFESAYAKMYGVNHAISCANGTDAIYITLKMCGIGAGDEVITAANTFIATSEAISQTGAKPVFVDCDKDFYHINTDLIEEKINKNTKAIIPVHLYGHAADLDSIFEIANRHKLIVIEDTAQAHFAEYNGKLCGSMGVAGTFSFYPGKNLGAYGDAGAIITNSSGLSEKFHRFKTHGSLQKYDHDIEGMNSRMDALHAAVLNIKLDYILEWNELRRQKANYYLEKLKNINGLELPKIRPNTIPVWHLFIIRAKQREELMEFLNKNGIATGLHYPKALPYTKAYSYMNAKPEDYPISYQYQSEIVSLPIFPELTFEQIDYIASKIKEFYK